MSDCASQHARRSGTVPEDTEEEDETKENPGSCEALATREKTGVRRRIRAEDATPGPADLAERQSVPVTTTATQVTFTNNNGPAQFLAPVAIFVVVLSALSAAFLKAYLEPPSAYDELRAYTISQSEGMKVESIAELPVDDLNSFAQSACVEARGAEDIRRALKANLRIPPEVRDMIISSAVVDGVSTSSTMSNTTSNLASDGTAISFVAFWSTVHTEPSLGGGWYSSCIMVAGITIAVSEEVAEWVTHHERFVTGTQPCHCGRFRCERCPVFQTRETRTPVFKRHSLTLKNQLHLRSSFASARISYRRLLSFLLRRHAADPFISNIVFLSARNPFLNVFQTRS